jgi:hypothetical protein
MATVSTAQVQERTPQHQHQTTQYLGTTGNIVVSRDVEVKNEKNITITRN